MFAVPGGSQQASASLFWEFAVTADTCSNARSSSSFAGLCLPGARYSSEQFLDELFHAYAVFPSPTNRVIPLVQFPMAAKGITTDLVA